MQYLNQTKVLCLKLDPSAGILGGETILRNDPVNRDSWQVCQCKQGTRIRTLFISHTVSIGYTTPIRGGYAPIISPPLPWLLRGVAEGYVTMVAEDIRGAYPPSRCGISHVTYNNYRISSYLSDTSNYPRHSFGQFSLFLYNGHSSTLILHLF